MTGPSKSQSLCPISMAGQITFQNVPNIFSYIFFIYYRTLLNYGIQKNQTFIMLKQQQATISDSTDPFANIFQEGMEEFVKYQKNKGSEYRSKAQRQKEKIAKLQRDLNDPQLKKQRNKERRLAEKIKMNQIMESMSQQELKKFMRERKDKKQQEKKKVRKAMTTGQVMMIDLVYEDKMNGKENRSLAKQIELIMKVIKHLDSPPSIHLCSFQGGVKGQLEKMGYQNWPITVHTQNIKQAGQKLGKKLVYLSPDAQEPLQVIEQSTAYILGGLIDRTILKNASLMRAKELGIQARRLPIRPFMKCRIVVNLDHVVLMVCKYKQINDWKGAFDYGAPKRWKKDAGCKKEEQQNSQSQQQGQECEKIEKSQPQKMAKVEQK